MKISVVVPCHNAEGTIVETLHSAAAQTYAPHEIIVVNDASTDDSRAQIENCGVQVRLIDAKVCNAGAARNLGIAAARGDWIALLDADDVWFPDHLEQAARLLEGGDDVAYLANHCFRRARGDAPIPDVLAHRLDSARGLSDEVWPRLLVRYFHFGHSSVLYRRARVLEVGGYDETFERLEDLDLWLRVLHGHTWAYGAGVAMAYRLDTPHSLSKDKIKSEYFYVQALAKNRAAYPGAEMRALTVRAARRVMGLSFVDGSAFQFRAARRVARPHLALGWRLFYALAPLMRAPLRHAIRLRRFWIWRHHPEI